MASQNIIQRLLIIRKSFRATAVLAWVFELITLTMEFIGDNTRFDKLAAIFLTMDSCFFTFWDVRIKFKDRSLAFGRVGRCCYFWPKHENGQPSWSPDVVCDVCSSVFVVCHFLVAVVDFVYSGHGPTYVFTLVAFVLASMALIPTQAYHRWLSATDHQPDDQQAEANVGSTADIDPSQQRENEEARVGIEVHDDDPSVSASVGESMDINLQSEVQCLQSMHNAKLEAELAVEGVAGRQ